MSILEELDDLQESDETVWTTTDLSFSIETRETDDELIHRTYTFNYSPEVEAWLFTEFEERRTRKSSSVNDREWRRSRSITWDDPEAATVDVPSEVLDQLEETLDCESVVLQDI